MTVSIRDAKHSPQDRDWVRSVYREYLEDLSMLNTGIFPVLGQFGEREPDLLARWFADDRSHPLVILQSDRPVGFALVVRPPERAATTTVPAGRGRIEFRLSEFFIQLPYRKRGVGREAAQLIFNRFAGQWEVTEYVRNSGAVAFWRRIIGAYTGGRYTERAADGEVHQWFKSASRPAA
jgi:predicted acetyltransferase